MQTLGGTGALKVGADFLSDHLPQAPVWISDPSWENHRELFESAGFKVNTYPYYDPTTRGRNFDAMLARSRRCPRAPSSCCMPAATTPPASICRQNSGARCSTSCSSRGLVPFLDIAYQGFADGLEEDAYAARLFAESLSPVFVSSSFSKSLSLYGERVGALSVVTGSADEAARVLSQVKRIIAPTTPTRRRTAARSSPRCSRTRSCARCGSASSARCATASSSCASASWTRSSSRVPDADFSFVLQQRGMFSYSGLTQEQVRALREESSIYAIDSGRICVAALNSRNVDYVADAIAKARYGSEQHYLGGEAKVILL